MRKSNSDDKTRSRQSGKQSAVTVAKAAGLVGIGASAGGLSAMLQLFESMPEKVGMAFVVIQHLDANKDSALADILSRATTMPVSVVRDDAVAQPNHVYVIAPGTELTVSHGVLTAAPQKSDVRRHTPIDSFLESLAMDEGNRAIGVILSGTGVDGSRGVREIKAVGGITLAQEPQSAEYDGMPRSTIATGMVDFVLTPAKIGAELSRIGQSLMITGPVAEAGELFPDEADELNRIIALLRKASGINFAEYKQLTIKRRILRRMVLLKIDRLGEYVVYLRQNGAELAALQQDMLINVTKFFREPLVFDTFKKVVFPSIISTAPANAPIRLWVPGCSTGEEAYSLAIALQEYLDDKAICRKIQIFATDINETVIDKARAGIYPKTIVADISPPRLSRFFVEVEQGYQISKAIRDICVFARQDIGQDPPISRVDLVSCRNVMIYFGPALHKRIFPIFHYALNPGGFLIMGASESVGVFADLFDLVDKKHQIYTKKSVATPMAVELSATEHAATVRSRSNDYPESFSGISLLDVQKEADRIVLGKYAPPGVIINSKLDIIQYRGRTGVYLEPASGMPSLNLMKMAREGLFAGLRAAIYQAKKENILVRKEGLHVLENGNSLQVNVDVVPINGSFQQGEYFLVLFQDAASQSRSNDVTLAREDSHQARATDEVLGLKQEVAATKEYLQSIIDQHEAANEEVQSSNEELMSMNEELETAKEELQSTNEELMTLNEEMGTRNMELNHINNDMINLLHSINIPVLILSGDLRIRRFNAVAKKVFNLIGADVERPIKSIKLNIDIPNLEQASLEVIDTLNSKEQEVQDRWGHWYSMQIRPYRTTDNKIDGVIITFADIDTIKKSLEVAREAQAYAEAIVETVRHPMVVLDAHLRLKTANKAFYQTFRLVPAETIGQSIFSKKDNRWNLSDLRTLLTDIVEHDTAFKDFAVSYDLPDIGWQKMLVNARRIVNPQNKAVLILMAFEIIAAQGGK
ncbi:chemotaxis protein CheB [Sporomusa termitida]|uniref:protein-glutamate O-methyltransferase n=1 Tax=Sporomusa termitida TaxID=2377 RepID=A0A517DV48_9FIRM|nr:chemotaxis protein CheB [Sporomusa termitida]QDR81223.1 Chemotaxis response regulator protein-glutamate methyleSPTERase [Sporomusa termitida]